MTFEKTRRVNFCCCRSIRTSLTAFAGLLIPVASGYAHSIPSANDSVKHSARASVESGEQSIRPFRVNVWHDGLTDLKCSLAAPRWPEHETLGDQSQGVPLATMKALVGYSQSSYGWHKVEAGLNAAPQFVTNINGVGPPPAGLSVANRPQTLYGIEDSPVGLAAWMLDHDNASLAPRGVSPSGFDELRGYL